MMLLLFSTSTSPLFIHGGHDSAVFQEMGLGILHGKVPYRDLFDNKGPLLYLINALGMYLGGRTGVFAIQVVANTMTLWLMYRIAREVAPWPRSLAALLLAMIPYSLFLGEGNLCEEWMLPFLLLAILLIITPPATSFGRHVALGACCAAVAMLRPNDTVLVGGLELGMAAHLFAMHKPARAARSVAFFTAGFASAAAPIAIWLAARGALLDFWCAVGSTNVRYVAGQPGSWLESLASPPRLLVAVMVVAMFALVGRRRPEWLWPLVPSAALECLCIGPNWFAHYYIPLLPFMLLLLAAALSSPRRWVRLAMPAALMLMPVTTDMHLLLPRALSHAWINAKDIALPERQALDRQRIVQSEALFAAIPLAERDSVWNYNLIINEYKDYHVLPHNGIVQMNPRIFPILPQWWHEPQSPLSAPTLPPWMVAGYGGASPENSIDSATLSRYQLVGTTDTTVARIALYRRR